MLYVNGIPFGDVEFGNGEAIYKKPLLSNECNNIEMVFEDNRDIANLCMAATYLDMDKPKAIKTLTMHYVPYSRMDREIGDQLFSLKYFAGLVNNLGFSKVYVMDAHSKETTDRITNVTEVSIDNAVQRAIDTFHPDFLFFPDKGAKDRYAETLNAVITNYVPHFFGSKKRDLNNKGKIIGYELNFNKISPEMILGSRILIIDDLCSRGGTFMAAAEQLKKAGAEHIGLYVTHCEKCIFDGSIFKTDLIEQVFTTNSMRQRLVTI